MSEKENSVSWFVVFKSSLMALLGVQSDKAYERDFTKGKPIQFIVMGLVLTFVFLLGVYGFVRLMLSGYV